MHAWCRPVAWRARLALFRTWWGARPRHNSTPGGWTDRAGLTGALALWGRAQRGLARGQMPRLCCRGAAVALEGGRACALGYWLVGAQSSSYTAACCSSCATMLRRSVRVRGALPLRWRRMALCIGGSTAVTRANRPRVTWWCVWRARGLCWAGMALDAAGLLTAWKVLEVVESSRCAWDGCPWDGWACSGGGCWWTGLWLAVFTGGCR